jgi:rare lipoprotein A (peptidoglycan hydrolase)
MKSNVAHFISLCVAGLMTWPASGSGGSPQSSAGATTGYATWYSRASCRREGTGGDRVLMANGKPLDDTALTCALWRLTPRGTPRRPDGGMWRVTALDTGRSVLVRWTDNGPGKRSRARGVVVDLSRGAMMALAGEQAIKAGRVRVKLEEVAQ